MTDQTARPLRVIAAEIAHVWKDPYFGALPYISAMGYLDRVGDCYGADSGRDIIQYFLSNARYWRGDDATRLKNELKVMIGQKPTAPSAAKPATDTVSADSARALRKHQAAIVKAAVVRHIFCPFTQEVLDMRRAVVVDTGTKTFVCTAKHWDAVKDDIFAAMAAMGEEISVYDGRELYTPAGRVR